MNTLKTSRIFSVLLIALVFAAPLPAALERPKAPVNLFLVIVVDQMRYDYLVRFKSLFQGGFRTLLEKGAVFTQARYRHANTETGPGHSVILSGRHGSHSGIVANTWYDSYFKKQVYVVEDPLQKSVGGEWASVSPTNFIGFTFGDSLKMRFPGTKVVGVSAKDRAAILMAGKLADGAFWFGQKSGHYITSTYYMKHAPDWLDTWNNKHDGDYRNIMKTPVLDEITLDFATEARRAYHLGERGDLDLFAISFSATDYIGHAYGPDGPEMKEQMVHLDRVIAKLLSQVDLSKTIVVLTADHGVLPLVEDMQAKHIPAKRVNPKDVELAVNNADFWLDKEKIHEFGLQIGNVENEIIQALKATGLMQAVYRQEDLLGDSPGHDPYFGLIQNSFFSPRSPDITGNVKEYVLIDHLGGGTSHGTPYEYDRHVPIIFMGPGIRSGVFQQACGPEDIAPTLASIAGLEYPKEADSRLLTEMFVQESIR
jgi:predicted AlkP superfamily pyrophosphatase or phosphodiesterase